MNRPKTRGLAIGRRARRTPRLSPFVSIALLLAGCSSTNEGGAGTGGGPAPGTPPPELGAPGRGTVVVVATAKDGLSSPTDLAFSPERPTELWVTNRSTNGVVIVQHAGAPDQTTEARVDRYGEHFMMKPSSLAFGVGDRFATCQESRDEWNDVPQAPDDFMGPTLWSADLAVFAKVGQIYPLVPGAKEGSHLDMLHESPLCMGIAHERDNVFWAFDGLAGNLVRYDFGKDHGAGGSDHSDGRARRYAEISVARVEGIPSHMMVDGGWLYLADTGHGRVVRVDVASGTSTGALKGAHERLAEYAGIVGATFEEIATGLDRPSGVAVHDGRLFVSESGTGRVIAYSIAEKKELARADTGRIGVSGLAIDGDGRLWIASRDTNEILRFDPGQ